ncbi:hypothetical protein GCM10023091_16760 [Ravibacter arvi]|uniref:Uncharacterized protein n=1 Tax=Ravibacter arvi TaxID=2051041 RepID=A0ABP8LUS2_9BACT
MFYSFVMCADPQHYNLLLEGQAEAAIPRTDLTGDWLEAAVTCSGERSATGKVIAGFVRYPVEGTGTAASFMRKRGTGGWI